MIEVRNLTKVYGKKKAVDDLVALLLDLQEKSKE